MIFARELGIFGFCLFGTTINLFEFWTCSEDVYAVFDDCYDDAGVEYDSINDKI